MILDIRLLGGSGIDVLRTLKQEKPSPHVIMLTNYPYPQYREKCLEAGADFFFDKSREFHQVTEVLQQLVRKRSPPSTKRVKKPRVGKPGKIRPS